MESRQIVWFAPECSIEELARMNMLDADGYIYESSEETDEGADHATRHLDNVDWCSCVDCRIMPTVEECLRLSCPPRRPPQSTSYCSTRNHEI